MHTEQYCKTLESLDPIKAIRAIHEAFLQLAALTSHIDCGSFDNTPSLSSLRECLKEAGHVGF